MRVLPSPAPGVRCVHLGCNSPLTGNSTSAIMSQLIQDFFFGRLMRHFSKEKLLPHEEAKHPQLLKQFMTSQGNNPSGKTSPERPASNVSTINNGNGDIVENGKDSNIVGWYGPDDPEVSDSVEVSFLQSVDLHSRIPSTDPASRYLPLPFSCAS